MRNSKAPSGRGDNVVRTVPPPLGNVPDIALSDHGSIVLFHPISEAARNWMREHCPADAEHSYFGGALAVEPRYVDDLLHFAGQDGLAVHL